MRPHVLRSPRTWWRHRATLVVALWFALAFLALRLIYRVVFGGFPEGGTDWASTIGGVVRSTLPFISVILLFGVLNVIVDLQGAMARGLSRGVLRRLRTVIVISLAAYPSLLESVRTVRWSRRMRRDRSLRSLLVPVLERALDRGITLGASLEQRGFGAGRVRVGGMCDAPVVARDLRIGFGDAWSLSVGGLSIAHGSCILITGDTGTGKSALLRTFTGRLQHLSGGWQEGVLEVGGLDRRGALPHETASFISIVEQNVREAFVASRVFDEIAFSLRILNGDESEVVADVALVARHLGITDLLGREIHELSAGEATLVAIAAALVTKPSLLLLDEPIADLDEANTQRIVEVLEALRRETGVTIVIAEHRWSALEHLADRRIRLRASEADVQIPRHSLDQGPVTGAGASARARASIAPLVAPNGAGKTTWMRDFAEAHPAHVRLVPENPELLFSQASVGDEFAHNDRLTKSSSGSTRALALALMPDLPVDAHPRDLSTGQRLALACALQATANPDLLLLDEPTRGLDSSARTRLTHHLKCLADTGTSIIFATHDREFAAEFTNGSRAEVRS
jgi:energy-coupling factor transport system ATP-binding protein